MESNWNRRAFLRLLGLTAGGTAFGMTAWSCGESRSAPAASPDALTEDELDKVVAMASDLFNPGDQRERSELDSTIRWWANGRTTRGPHLRLYRDGLAAHAGGTAAEALRNEILEGIYSTGLGWKSLGYTTWPGIPSEPLEYTMRPHDPAPIARVIPLAEIHG